MENLVKVAFIDALHMAKDIDKLKAIFMDY